MDTWAAYKRLYVDPQQRNKAEGIVDFPPFWNLKARKNMRMHWDGNIGAAVERNVVSALAVIGERLGIVERIEDIGTDVQQHLDFSPELANRLNQLGTDQWELRNFAPQHGYVNNLLDGIWLRAPYLHNGSVPTLCDLLKKPGDRPTVFCRGDTVIDWENVGYVSGMISTDMDKPCGKFFLYDTAVTGNSNSGHLFGTDLDEGEKDAVIEFLKTL